MVIYKLRKIGSNKKNLLCALASLIISVNVLATYDVTLLGYIKSDTGLGQLPITFIENLNKNLKINFIPNELFDLSGICPEVIKILNDPDKTSGNVILFTSVLEEKTLALMPQVKKILLAYSMWESSAINPAWVKILNKRFDAVILPDKNLVPVYKNSGVHIPIFVLPWGLRLEKLLQQPLKQQPHGAPFVFGLSSSFQERKNIQKLIIAFAQEFGNNKKFQLRLHCVRDPDNILKTTERAVMELINKYNYENIILDTRHLNFDKYVEFISSLDCYVSLSKGEGYSIGPREAMAAGIPAIITDCCAQHTICASGFVKIIKSDIPVVSDLNSKIYLSYFFDCKIQDVRAALRNVVNNYEKYLSLAVQGRTWASQYLFKNIKNKFLSLIKPNKVIFGKENIIENDSLVTNSANLFHKYKSLIELNKKQ